jgi:putative FmdB family regulatory protein
MPIYEYLCQDCGNKFEKLVRRAADVAGMECPACGRKQLKQEFSTFAAHAGNGSKKAADAPMCPSGGTCPTPGMCGLN